MTDTWLREVSPITFAVYFPVTVIDPEGNETIILDCTIDTMEAKIADVIARMAARLSP
jgi:hypothetical protein